MTKPVPHTLTYYVAAELTAYVKEHNAAALWTIADLEWRGDESGCDLADIARDAAEFQEVYRMHHGEDAAKHVAWMREQFGDQITVRRW